MARRPQLLVLTVVVLAACGVGTAAAASKPQVLVSVSATGGMCKPSICHWSARITTTTISADDRRSRRLTVAERRALTAAITQLKPTSLPPFTGTCPIAYDGQERHYRFTGKRPLHSCTNDLRRVKAVQLVDRLVASLPQR
jgi:hypothetical protein